MRLRQAAALLAVAALVATPVHASAATTIDQAQQVNTRVVNKPLRAAIKGLPLHKETRQGYDRDRFGSDWTDADGDCRDTRDEVLAQESKVSVGSDCDVRTGRWRSYYDNATWTDSGDVDIDHMVPLAEAWDSGAKRWTGGTRLRYANDLGDRRSLVAVTDNVNQSKGDGDMAEWVPQFHRCRYLREYTATKIRWSLRVDRPEKRAMLRLANKCGNRALHVRKARVKLR